MLRKQTILALSLGLFSLNSMADPQHIVVVPNCLLKNFTAKYEIMAQSKTLQLIKLNHENIPDLNTAKLEHARTFCGGFIDVTTAWKENKTVTKSAKDFLSEYTTPKKMRRQKYIPSTLNYPKQVNDLISAINPEDMQNDLKTLTGFDNRNADTEFGVKAAEWIKSQVELLAQKNDRTDITTYLVPTPNYKQSSLIVKMGNSIEPGIVIGAHMDTTYLYFPNPIQPGADDDGSGSTTVLEVARLILNSHMQFKKPIYFIWYAAEEEGLLGSQAVVKTFTKQQIPISNVLHFDMTGYVYQSDPAIYLVTDHVDPEETNYLETLINAYVNVPVQRTRCGYACSDHASWTKAGIPSAIPFETAFEHYNPNIHSTKDTMEFLSLEHMTNFAKLGAAFAVELAEPIDDKSKLQ